MAERFPDFDRVTPLFNLLTGMGIEGGGCELIRRFYMTKCSFSLFLLYVLRRQACSTPMESIVSEYSDRYESRVTRVRRAPRRATFYSLFNLVATKLPV